MNRVTKRIDLNCDLGEGYNDGPIFSYISSCHIACGGHYGSKKTMRQAITSALEHKVAIGAHPAYPDKENFGRKVLDISIDILKNSIEDQLNTFLNNCEELGTKPTHIKPHGALYNAMAKDKNLSQILLQLFTEIYPNTVVYGLSNSAMDKVAQEMKIPFIREGFSDRAYTQNKSLVSRSTQGAVLTEWAQIKKQLDGLLSGQLSTINSTVITLEIESICLHGDTPGAVNTIKQIYEYVKSKGYAVHSYR